MIRGVPAAGRVSERLIEFVDGPEPVLPTLRVLQGP